MSEEEIEKANEQDSALYDDAGIIDPTQTCKRECDECDNLNC